MSGPVPPMMRRHFVCNVTSLVVVSANLCVCVKYACECVCVLEKERIYITRKNGWMCWMCGCGCVDVCVWMCVWMCGMV